MPGDGSADMLRIRLELDSGGTTLRLAAVGHARGKPGENLACAAATVLIRTAARWLNSLDDVQMTGRAANEGELSFSASSKGATNGRTDCASVLANLYGYLATGLGDLAREFPEDVSVEFDRVGPDSTFSDPT